MIDKSKIKEAEKILIDNGIEEDEASTVLQAIGYALLDEELYPRTFKASNIKWDTSDSDDEVDVSKLPSEETATIDDLFPFADSMSKAELSDDEIEEAFGEYLSAKHKFCHCGFAFEEIEE